MNATELADLIENEDTLWLEGRLSEIATMLRQQQAEIERLTMLCDCMTTESNRKGNEIEALEKENTDLRYLIATKLEQQDGISLNSMAHPITNTPEPSYEIDPDKLETIEIDLPSPEPVAWAVWEGRPHDLFFYKEEADELCRLKGGDAKTVPLYTHPVKELHLSLQKSKQTGELLAVTYTDDEHRIVEVLWQRPPVKELTDEEIGDFTHRMVLCCGVHPNSADINVLGLKFIVEEILRKAKEK